MRWYGETDMEKKTIRINKKLSRKNPSKKRPLNKHASRYPDVLDTIVHEIMHARHPKRHEKTVRKATLRYIRGISKKTKKKLYSKFAHKEGAINIGTMRI